VLTEGVYHQDLPEGEGQVLHRAPEGPCDFGLPLG
jgi:hypothetical protein